VYTLLLMNESKSSWLAHFDFVKQVYQPHEVEGEIQGDPEVDMPIRQPYFVPGFDIEERRQIMDQDKGSRAAWKACFQLGQSFACTKHRTDNVAMAANGGKGALTT